MNCCNACLSILYCCDIMCCLLRVLAGLRLFHMGGWNGGCELGTVTRFQLGLHLVFDQMRISVMPTTIWRLLLSSNVGKRIFIRLGKDILFFFGVNWHSHIFHSGHVIWW